MRIILIWEEVPEQTTVFVFEDVKSEEVEIFKRAHGNYVNSEIEDPSAIMWVNDYLEGLENRDSYKTDEPVKCDVESIVIVCGIIL